MEPALRASTGVGINQMLSTTLSPEAQRLLDDVAASARLEGQELPADDLERARAYLAGDIDAATFQQRVRELVAGTRRPAQSA